MKIISFLFTLTIFTAGNLFAGTNPLKHNSSEKEKEQFARNIRGNNMVFTLNKGQIVDMKGDLRPDVLFKGNTGDADVYLRKTGISYVRSNINKILHEIEEQVERTEKKRILSKEETDKLRTELLQKETMITHRLDVDFLGGNVNPDVQSSDRAEGHTNYYYAHCPQGITQVYSYNTVVLKNIYSGIDVKYYSSAGGTLSQVEGLNPANQGLKYDIVVNAGADPNQVKLKYTGYKNMKLKKGNLCIETALGVIEESLPKVYQVINGEIINVKAYYVLSENKKEQDEEQSRVVSFSLGRYNTSYPLVIDPYTWATYYGGSTGYEYSSGIAVDAIGNSVITGWTSPPNSPYLPNNFPTGATAGNTVFQPASAGTVTDAFVVKFDPSGSIRLWATYYGGTADDRGWDIATDPSGNVAITGYTQSTNFPVGAAAGNSVFQAALAVVGGGRSAFVIKFDPTGAQLWATYYGGSSDELGIGIAMDPSGNIAITGETSSANFPTGAAAGYSVFQAVYGTGVDAFIVKFDPVGARLWATFYGGSNAEYGWGIATDLSGNIVITGQTQSTNFPTGAAVGYLSFQPASGGFIDAIVVKFDPTGARLWATYYGGSFPDVGWDIATDPLGNVVITGYTNSTNFPVGATAGNSVFQAALAPGLGSMDAFVVKFAPNGSRLWATYHGGNQGEFTYSGRCITDSNGNIYIMGEWEDTNNGTFPMNTCALRKTFGGIEDWFVTKFSPTGNRICSTFIGASGEEDLDYGGGGIATWQNFVYVTGSSIGGNFPTTAGAFQPNYAGGSSDVVVAKFCGNSCGDNNSITVSFNAIGNLCSNSAAQFTPAVTSALTCDTNSYLYKWYFPGGIPSSSTQRNPGAIMYATPGNYTVSLVVDGICNRDSVRQSIVIANCNACNLSAVALPTNVSCGSTNNGSINLTASSGTAPFTYSWSNGASSVTNSLTSNISNLSGGIYSVTVTDANGCTAISNAIINPSLAAQYIKGTANCTGCGCKEWIMTTASGGTGPYSYLWSTLGGIDKRYQNKLCPGNYTIKVMDKNGCSVNVIVNAP
jgi:hypothetical protein